MAKATQLADMDFEATQSLSQKLLAGVPSLRTSLNAMLHRLKEDPAMLILAEHSAKLDRLLDLVGANFKEHGNDGYRGIIFVEQVALVSALTKRINRRFNQEGIFCGAVAGTGSQTEDDRQAQLRALRSGQVRILVSTAALEEGIDVSSCEFVIRFSFIATTKAKIQGDGRARHPQVCSSPSNDLYINMVVIVLILIASFVRCFPGRQ